MEIDEQTLKRIIDEYGDMIYRLALHYVRSREDAEDVVQEVLLAYYLHAPSTLKSEKAWLIRVTVNKSLNALKKHKRYCNADMDESFEIASAFDDGEVLSQVRRLNETDRKIVFLKYYEDKTSDEIGKILRTSGAYVRKRLMKIKSQLKDFFEE